MSAVPSTGEATPRRVHRRRWGAAPVVMVLAGVLALVLTLGAVRTPASGRRVVVAARDLPAGIPLERDDVRVVRLSGDAAVTGRLVDAGARWRGQVPTVAVPAGDPLVDTFLRARPTDDGRRAMSIPVERARAVNGRLAPGDRVDVVRARDGIASVVAAGLEVLDVEDDRDGAFGTARGLVTVTLAVDVVDSQRLAAVLADGDFVLTRVTGATPATGAPPVALDPLADLTRVRP